MQHVADDRDRDAVEAPERLADREEVEQRLGRVLVLPVAGVDDVRAGRAGDEVRRADVRMPDDDHVRLVLRERLSAVSRSDSPLSTDDPAARRVIVSAERRFAASSKLASVRVDDS